MCTRIIERHQKLEGQPKFHIIKLRTTFSTQIERTRPSINIAFWELASSMFPQWLFPVDPLTSRETILFSRCKVQQHSRSLAVSNFRSSLVLFIQDIFVLEGMQVFVCRSTDWRATTLYFDHRSFLYIKEIPPTSRLPAVVSHGGCDGGLVCVLSCSMLGVLLFSSGC